MRIELLQGPEERVDAGVVRDVIAEVRHRGWKDGRDPDRVDAELPEMRQPLLDAAQIADAVAVRVLERARVDLVQDRGLPPRHARHDPVADQPRGGVSISLRLSR